MRFLIVAALAAAFVLAAPLVLETADATRHDPCVHNLGGNVGQDSGNSWFFANRMLQPFNCIGEMDPLDPDDWYFINVPQGQTSAALTVTVCLDFTTIAPFETSISVYFLPLASVIPFIGLPPFITDQIQKIPAPGLPLGSSNNPGCDQVSATVGAGAGLGRWYINVHREAGQGGYTFATA